MAGEPTHVGGQGPWDDDLSWCPSQCQRTLYADDGTPAVLYLRWRHDDPWTADLIRGFTTDDDAWVHGGEWEALSFGEWSSTDELDLIKASAERAALTALATPAARSES